ncbi:hypothetical protein KGF57_005112 [Candida theae]|uniref:H/ACA ribonucleoprotein complex non-core subunit NAF1 n=1 Tax=Candida theae TaxID=1198502 RepID=A0AAD5BAX5_9ASCO|nr:uncharacterized protein KGF57_005112 [Candida theae]KAI5948919.1 hypothetical protein KGF57_005112 [Candida theae]
MSEEITPKNNGSDTFEEVVPVTNSSVVPIENAHSQGIQNNDITPKNEFATEQPLSVNDSEENKSQDMQQQITETHAEQGSSKGDFTNSQLNEVAVTPENDSQLKSSSNEEQEERKEETPDQIASFITQGQSGDIKVDVLSDDEIDVKDVSSDDSSSEDDSNSGNSDTDSSEEEDENEDEQEMNETGFEGDEEEEEVIDGPIKSINEVTDEKVPSLPEGYTVPYNAPIEEIGEVTGLVDKAVIIKAKTSGEFRILKEGSVLCLEDKTPIGLLYEIFGRVQQPVYTVKFNSDEDFQKFKDSKGKTVFYVVPESQFLYTDTIKHIKGTDASNCHDEELPEEEQEFSDDEQELAAKQAKKRKKNKNKVVKDREHSSISAHKAHIPAYSPITTSRPGSDSARRTQHHRPGPVSSYSPHLPTSSHTYPQSQPYIPQPNQFAAPSPYHQNNMYSNPQPQYQQSVQSFGTAPQSSQFGQIPYAQSPQTFSPYGHIPYQQPPQNQFQQYMPNPNQVLPQTPHQSADPAQLARLQELLILQMQNQQQQQHPPPP